MTEKLNGQTAQVVYDQIAAKLSEQAFHLRALFERFAIEVLCTTDAATDLLAQHQAIRASGWRGDICPTFRPDAVVNLDAAGWRNAIDRLSQASGIDIASYDTFVQALEQRRAFFSSLGAMASDHAAAMVCTVAQSAGEAAAIFQRALAGQDSQADARRFTGHMLMEMARMSVEEGLVLQLHIGSVRNHNGLIYQRFGPDKGCDIPRATDFVHDLRPLLNAPEGTAHDYR